MRLFSKYCLVVSLVLQVAAISIIFGVIFLQPVAVFADETGSLKQQCQVVIADAVQKKLSGIEDLEIEKSDDVEKWISGRDADSQVSVLQVGCWNRRNGVIPVQIGLVSEGVRESRRWFKIRVKGKTQVLLALRDLKRGEPVRSTDFVSSLVDCKSLKREVVNSIPEKMIFQLTCNLKEGEPLPAKRLKPYRMIKRGEMVHVVLSQGGIKVLTRGIAMGDGALQDLIMVKNPASKKYYQARVIAQGEVVVRY